MTREERLYTMTMACLVEVANKLGIKIDKKGAKSKAVAKILAAEEAQKPAETAEKQTETAPAKKPAKQAEVKTAETTKVVNDDTCADGRTYAEIGKEIAEQAKKKAKDAKKSDRKTERVEVKQTLIDTLEACGGKYRVVGKRVRLVDANDKCYAYLLSNKSVARLYIRADVKQFSIVESIASDNVYSKSSYKKTAIIEFDNIAKILPELATR